MKLRTVLLYAGAWVLALSVLESCNGMFVGLGSDIGTPIPGGDVNVSLGTGVGPVWPLGGPVGPPPVINSFPGPPPIGGPIGMSPIGGGRPGFGRANNSGGPGGIPRGPMPGY